MTDSIKNLAVAALCAVVAVLLLRHTFLGALWQAFMEGFRL